jgi:Matrixin
MKENQHADTGNLAFELATHSFLPTAQRMHVYGKNVVCITDSKGAPEPVKPNPNEIVVDSSEGFIPLWDKDVTLNWRFEKSFGSFFKKPEAAMNEIRKMLNEAVDEWGAACPVKFLENNEAWDFEVKMRQDDCSPQGCVLASAFFPHQGQDELVIYPKMLTQPRDEQIATLVHELGHIFGLRHFFAQISEQRWKSEIFGKHEPFSIMNYGSESVLTKDDISDLCMLYEMIWSGQLTHINGTKIVKFKPYHVSK